MNYWIIPANPTIYRHKDAIEERGYIEWKQGRRDYQVNDIVYLYISAKVNEVRYRMRIEKVNIPYSRHENDNEYWIDKSRNTPQKWYCKLVFDDECNSRRLSYDSLKAHGQESTIQSAEPLRDSVRKYIESVWTSSVGRRDSGVNSKKITSSRNGSPVASSNLTKDTFISSLILPDSVKPYRYRDMDRVHFKYNGEGFLVIDMRNTYYHLGTREGYLRALGINDFEFTDNLGPNHALIRNIPFSDTSVLYGLVKYISGTEISAKEEELLQEEMQQIANDIEILSVPGEEKLSIVKTRVNQSYFRDRLIRKYGKCCLCGMSTKEMLIASHIQPWSVSEPLERTDEDNGLLLCPNHDRLFDRGYISFDDSGNIKISNQLSEVDQILMNVHSDMRVKLEPGSKKYMTYHRNNVFIPG